LKNIFNFIGLNYESNKLNQPSTSPVQELADKGERWTKLQN